MDNFINNFEVPGDVFIFFHHPKRIVSPTLSVHIPFQIFRKSRTKYRLAEFPYSKQFKLMFRKFHSKLGPELAGPESGVSRHLFFFSKFYLISLNQSNLLLHKVVRLRKAYSEKILSIKQEIRQTAEVCEHLKKEQLFQAYFPMPIYGSNLFLHSYLSVFCSSNSFLFLNSRAYQKTPSSTKWATSVWRFSRRSSSTSAPSRRKRTRPKSCAGCSGCLASSE